MNVYEAYLLQRNPFNTNFQFLILAWILICSNFDNGNRYFPSNMICSPFASAYECNIDLRHVSVRNPEGTHEYFFWLFHEPTYHFSHHQSNKVIPTVFLFIEKNKISSVKRFLKIVAEGNGRVLKWQRLTK